jgi:hypothetical protein
MSGQKPNLTEVKALWEEYQRVSHIYLNARCTAVDKAIASVSSLKGSSDNAYEAYRLARYYPGTVTRESPKDSAARVSLWSSFLATVQHIPKGEK